METELTIVILAAGLGTRMRSAKAKVLHRAGGKALVEHVVDTALELTLPEHVFVVVGHQAAQVRETLASRGVGFIEQKEQKGTGHALLCGRRELENLGRYLIVLYGDCPLISSLTLRRLIAAREDHDAAASLITAELDDPTGYGRIIMGDGGVAAIVEQKAATADQLAIKEINSGIYCFRSADFWRHAGDLLPNNPAQEYYLTDIVELFHRAGLQVTPMRIGDASETMGINTRVELARVDALFRARKVQELMLAGVTIEKPETVTIDAPALIGMDTVVQPFARILGASRVGQNCVIGACSILEDARLGDRVEVKPFSHVAASELADDAQVGPYARIRMGASIEPGAHIGNFVEVKKSRVGAKAKAMHLAYIGDAQVGAGANIGAGTITCNYDGLKKHTTKIGERAFVGSNSTLVAPVEVGEGAYVGAGSVITERVPAGALALGRARQVNKEGWSKKRKGERG